VQHYLRAFTMVTMVCASFLALTGCGGRHSAVSVLPREASGGARHVRTIVEAAYPNAVLADSPLAYYRLDDTGSTLTDSSSNGLNGSYGSSVTHGAASLVSTNSDAATTFPGGSWSANGIATVAKNTALQPTNITIEGWVKESAANSGGFIDVVSYGPQSSGQAWSIQITPSNTFSFYVLTPTSYAYVAGSTVLSTGTAYHVAGSYDGTTARLYVNGQLEASAAGSGNVNYGSVGTYGLSIGGGQSTSRNILNGAVDDVSIYGSALTAARIQAHYAAGTTTPTSTGDPYATTVMGDSPAAYYRLDDAGSLLADATTHQLNGSYGSSITHHATGLVTGTSDYAATFSGSATGSTTTAQVSQSSTLQPTSVSVEAWVKESSTPSGIIDVVSYGDQHGQGYSLQIYSTNQAAFYGNTTAGAGYFYVQGTTTLSTGTVYHLVGTYDGTTAKIYVNGTLEASATASGSVSYSGIGSYGLSIGGGQNSSRNTLPGTIDEVAVYPSVLTSTQIANHHSKGAASAPAGPTHVQNWLYACDANQTCVSDQNTGISDSWMASHVDWNEVYFRNDQDTTGANLAASGAKHIVVYVDPNITYYCAIPSGYSVNSNDFPENGANCGGQVASYLHAQSGSYAHAYQHQTNGNRLFDRADGLYNGDVGEPLYIGDPDVQAAFAAATSQNPYATDVFEDDAGGAYNCLIDYGRCDSGSSFGSAHYSPPLCDSSGGYWCYKYGETAVEWDGASNPQQAYANDAIALANASAHNVIGNNGIATNSYDLQWLAATKVKGAMLEGTWSPNQYDSGKWVKIADAILNYHNRGKYVVEEDTDETLLLFEIASHWIVYDPTYSVEALFEVNPATTSAWTNDTTFPEESVVPSSPRVATPSNNDVTTFQTSTPGLFVREYATCYQAGSSIGRCAAVVNTNTSSKTITGLSYSYGHVLVQNTSTTWAAGGTAQWSTSVPTTIGATSGVILAQ